MSGHRGRPSAARTAAELLRIDVESELERLAGAQLQGWWQVPAELVRWVVSRGATEVSVRFRKGGVTVRADGARVEVDELEQLRLALDPGGSVDDRQRAIAVLEAVGGQAVLWAARLPAARLEVRATGAAGVLVLVCGAGVRPQCRMDVDGAGEPAVELQVRGRLDRRRALRWLSSACRFVPVPVTSDGVRITGRPADALVSMPLRSPADGIVWITSVGSAPRLYLLRHGVVAARAAVPGYPAFRAALEMGRVVGQDASAAALREAVRPWLLELIDQAVRLLLRLGDRVDDLPAVTGQRVVDLLLRAAGQGLRADEVRTVPIVPLVSGDGVPQRLPISRLTELAEERGGVVEAILPGQDPGAFVTGGAEVAVLSVEQRSLLADLAGVRFQSPPRRPVGRAIVKRLRRLLTAFSAWPRYVTAALRGERRLEPDDLEEAERALLEAVGARLTSAAGHPCAAVFVSGSGPVRVDHGRRLILPRLDPTVRAALTAVRRDPLWLYPALTAILGEEGDPPPDLRARWLRAAMRGGMS